MKSRRIDKYCTVLQYTALSEKGTFRSLEYGSRARSRNTYLGKHTVLSRVVGSQVKGCCLVYLLYQGTEERKGHLYVVIYQDERA